MTAGATELGSAATPGRGASDAEPEATTTGPVLASDEEVLRSKSFDALEPGELAQLTG